MKKVKLFTGKFSVFSICVCALLIVYVLSVAGVLFWGLLTSLKSYIDFGLMGNVIGLPDLQYSSDALLFRNYRLAIQYTMSLALGNNSYISTLFGFIELRPRVVPFWEMIANSFIYSTLCSGAHVICVMTVSYLCAKFKYAFSKILNTTMLIVMMIPIVGTAPAKVTLMRDLGLSSNYLGMVIMNFHFTGMYYFIFYAHFQGMSDTYTEAACLDGASQLQIFVKIIVPLSAKMIGTIFVLSFIGAWNGYQDCLMFFPAQPTLSYGLQRITSGATSSIQNAEVQSLPVMVAACMILALPLIVLFLSMKDVILGSMTMGGVKE